MIRTLLSTVFALTLAAGCFAQDFAGDEARLLKLAEDQVVAAVTIRGNQPRISGSAMIDADHIQVDLFYVNENEMIVPNSAERFVFNLLTNKIMSVGAPTGEIAILPAKDVVNKVQSDALTRFSKVHPGMGTNIPDGVNPEVKDTKRDTDGTLHVTCESFGGIAGMWFGDAITYSYNAAGQYLRETR